MSEKENSIDLFCPLTRCNCRKNCALLVTEFNPESGEKSVCGLLLLGKELSTLIDSSYRFTIK